MGLDLIWCEVDWDELSLRYPSQVDSEMLVQALDDDGYTWLQRIEMEDEWLSLFESWHGLLEFNDEMIDYERDTYDALLREFPVLKDCGVIWNAETLSQEVPYELADPEVPGNLQGALSPATTRDVHQELLKLDRKRLREILEDSDSVGDGEIFDDAEGFVHFVDAITTAFSASAAKGRGMLMFCFG